MTNLLLHAPAPDSMAPETCFGGVPIVPISLQFQWPVCSTCNGNMQFLGRIAVPSESANNCLLLLFMCNNDPGMCDDWDPNSGGNYAMLVGATDLSQVQVPSQVEILETYGARTVPTDESYDPSSSDILGQLFGQPDWIQADETPHCTICDKAMRFIAQLEQGPLSFNFGGGCAYAFDCQCSSAKLLWQC